MSKARDLIDEVMGKREVASLLRGDKGLMAAIELIKDTLTPGKTDDDKAFNKVKIEVIKDMLGL